MNSYIKTFINCCYFCLVLGIVYGCSTQKDNAANRSLQNLSARYNFIYNSNILLTAYQDALSENTVNDYGQLLPVYIAPASIDYLTAASNAADTKTLDEISQKAQTIISEKGLSNYVDEAYLLMAKTNFYRGDYFTAAAYFDYTAKAFSADRNVYLQAMTWKARSLMQLNEDEKAIKVLDTVHFFLDSTKKDKTEALATLAQMSLYQQDYKMGIEYLEQAVKESNRAQNKIRWSFILAQLYENEKQYESSLRNYTRVEKSNAPFELYFNAKLSKIRIDDAVTNQPSNRRSQLLKLLKDDKNFDYTDQIYYEVAEDYSVQQDFKKAEEYYKLAAQKSVRNVNQKGLSYLRLADLNFKNLRNYVNAKLYYDSAAASLSKNYPGYDAVVKKGENLAYLTERYEVIAKQDTLQAFAKLPKQERLSRMDKMFANAQNIAQQPPVNQSANTALINNMNEPLRTQMSGTFYFSNASAIGRGIIDFKKRWGNRSLEDNWRQSLKSSAQVNQQNQTNAIVYNHTDTNNNQQIDTFNRDAQIAAFEASLPLTPELLEKSDQQITDAYFEIGGFYQQVLKDQAEAITVYESLLARYPKNNHLEAIYYSLYLAYAPSDMDKSQQYKNLVLTKFPNSVYAKTILDPNFSYRQNELDLAVNRSYNEVFHHYEEKNFKNVISSVNETNKRFPGNSLQAQYDYLKAIAIGRTQNVDSLMLAFNGILEKYPNDVLINPLVKDHLAYINAHLAAFKARKIALTDFDPTEPRFNVQQQPMASILPDPLKVEPVKADPVPVAPKTTSITSTSTTPQISQNLSKPPTVGQLFTKAESSTYYYVVMVNDISLSVSSSRFGIGQFNRGNYPGTGIKHQLLELDEDQLIFVGNFNTLNDVKLYAEGISPQLTKIMKVPPANYKGFYISKENFEKIKNIETLNSYLEFFKNNF